MAISSQFLTVHGAAAEELLQIQGNILKWNPPAPGERVVVTYAVLSGPYAVARDKSTLSPDNCSAMHAFADITARSPSVSEDVAMAELRSAFGAWSAVADISFVEVDDANRANIVIGAADAPEGRAFANLSYRSGEVITPVAKALGKSGPDLSTRSHEFAANGAVAPIQQAYVCLNPQQRWKVGFDGDLKVYDLRHTFTHEIGHAIGLDHPGRSGSIMAYRYDERVQQLQSSDIAAVQNLYGPRKREE